MDALCYAILYHAIVVCHVMLCHVLLYVVLGRVVLCLMPCSLLTSASGVVVLQDGLIALKLSGGHHVVRAVHVRVLSGVLLPVAPTRLHKHLQPMRSTVLLHSPTHV